MSNISTGHWIFAAVFALAFILFMWRAYAKDKKVNRQHYSGTFKILIGIILIMSALFALVKLASHFLK